MNADDAMDLNRRTLALILAGGRGERLYPLTRDRTKGAVPFGGSYRLIDFTLSNCLHSGLRRIGVLPQYKYASLEGHLRRGWNLFRPEVGECLALIPPQQRANDDWYQGTADAVFQNLYTLRQENLTHTLILSSDHLYRMDYRLLLEFHSRCKADLTIACIEVNQAEAHRFGIIEADANHRVVNFTEKPTVTRGQSDCALASMGIYVFETAALIKMLTEDADCQDSSHDFGCDIIPRMLEAGSQVCAYDAQVAAGEPLYWRDIGTLDAYWAASMELLAVSPPFVLDDPRWPLHTYQPVRPPARICLEADTVFTDSLVCPGVCVTNAWVEKSILSPGVKIGHEAEVIESILMDGVQVGPGARIHRSIIDKDVCIPAGCCIGGDDPRAFHVSPGGVTVIPRGADLSCQEEEAQQAHSYYGNGHIPPGRHYRTTARMVHVCQIKS